MMRDNSSEEGEVVGTYVALSEASASIHGACLAQGMSVRDAGAITHTVQRNAARRLVSLEETLQRGNGVHA